MPSVSLRPLSTSQRTSGTADRLPNVLQTPSGLAMIELQGTVLTENHGGQVVTDALQLGRLVFPPREDVSQDNGNGDGTPVILFIGKHQRMAGEIKKLSKPVAVVRRKPLDANVANSLASAGSATEILHITEIIYHKILFKHRPEPMGGEREQLMDDEAEA